MVIPGRMRFDSARLGERTQDSDAFMTPPHDLLRKLVIALAVVAVIVGGTTLSVVASRHVANPPAPLISRLDYQTSDFKQWTEQHVHRYEQEAIVTTPAHMGYPHTARFIAAPGDRMAGPTGVERAEVMASIAQTGNPVPGQTMWFAWSTFIPAGTQVDSDVTSPVGNGWLVFSQWHGTADAGPGANIAFSLTKGTSTPRLILDTNGGSGSGTRSEWVQSTALPLGHWVDFVVGITWGTSSSVGRMTVKTNGTTWLNNAPCANLYTGQSAYFKQGIYRSASNRTHTLYHTGTRIGPTEDSITRDKYDITGS